MRSSPAAARRAASGSPSNCLRSTPAPKGLGFPRSHRLTKRADLETVAREGKRLRTTHLEARVTASPRSHPRVGFIVPRYKHTAVERNRLKRRLRELARARLLPALAPVDLVVRARPSAYAIPFTALADEMARLSTQAPRGDTSS